MRKSQIVYLFLLMFVIVVVAVRTIPSHTAYARNLSVEVSVKTAPVFAHCFCRVKSNGTEVDSLSFDGYKQVLDKGKCETKCRGEWDNSGPGNSQIVAWGKKLSGACGNVRVSMDAYVGTSNPNEVRATLIDVGIPCSGGGGSGQTQGNSVSAEVLGTDSIRMNFSAEKSPTRWKIRWSRLPHPPSCDAAFNSNEATQDNTSDITQGSYVISGLKSKTTYYCDVCALYSGPFFKFIGQTKAKTK